MMSNKTLKFKNPNNGYVIEYKLAWLWTLLFGSLYLAYKGCWIFSIGALIAAIATGGFSFLIAPFFAKNLIEKEMLTRGWIPC